LRSVTFYSIITGGIIVVVSLVIIWGSPNSIPFVFIGATQACLTLSLVWYNLSRNPDLGILKVNIEPEDDKGGIVAKDDFVIPVQNSKRPVVEGKPAWKRLLLKRGRKVECEKTPSKLRISFDIVNRGGSGITIHEVRYKLLNSGEKFVIIPLFGEGKERKYLKEKERITESFRFPWHGNNLQKGTYRFRLALFTYIQEKRVELLVEVSEDKKVIKWWQWKTYLTTLREWIREWIERIARQFE